MNGDKNEMNPTCLICSSQSDSSAPFIIQGAFSTLAHYRCAPNSPKAYRGHLLVESKRHVPSFAEVNPEEAAEIGSLIARASFLQKEFLGAEHVYMFTLGHLVSHLHIHIVPRYPGTPKEFWGGWKLSDWSDAPFVGPDEIQALTKSLREKIQ
jgi:diadenosine tetraphosphate (Ap4A) HIT family hydrolase